MGAHKLDRIDLKILAQLQRNGRMTNIHLAEAVALSPSPCLARLKRLEKEGYILSYNAHVDVKKLGQTATLFTEITLSGHHKEDFAKFERRISEVEEVTECHLISGGYDYLLKFVTRDILHYQTLIEEILEADFGIDKYFTYVVLKSPIERQHYPIEKLVVLDK